MFKSVFSDTFLLPRDFGPVSGLVVERDRGVCNLIHHVFSILGIPSSSFATCEAACEIARRMTSGVSLMLLDSMLVTEATMTSLADLRESENVYSYLMVSGCEPTETLEMLWPERLLQKPYVVPGIIAALEEIRRARIHALARSGANCILP